MKITCEGCNKTYNIDLEKMEYPQVKSKCKACGETIIITKPSSDTDDSPSSFNMDENDFSGLDTASEAFEPPPISSSSDEINLGDTPSEFSAARTNKQLRFGLRSRLFVFFFLIPIILIAVEGYFYLRNFNDLSLNLISQSTDAVKKLAEQIIAEKAHAVAGQVRLYLESHPSMQPEQFYKDDYFKTLAMQQVGKTGYTAMHVAEDKDSGAYTNWIHSNPAVVGTDLRNLSSKLPKFWAILSVGKNGKESSGYYDWLEKDGSYRSKFMVCTPVIGTPYYVAATTYMDEFTVEIDQMKTSARLTSKQTQNNIIYISLIILILIGSITFWYGRSLTSKIKSLTDLTERISVGDLEAEIIIKSNDEIGDLGNAISRMQDSIRISIERLRRRK
ncbi:MAG: HAMP domain-containing protein [Desulfobacteraceae bacterium]|nr:MAG: HAMP domain-containing protein [Desulfobacteraceae bacterium]